MKKISMGKLDGSDEFSTQSHKWTAYLNPRNKKVSLNACAHCGVLKNMVSDDSSCVDISSRIANMLVTKGWVEQQA